MAVVTSSAPELCRAALKRNQLAEYFSQLFFAQKIGLEKRDPELFRTVAARLGTAPTACTLFDDSPVACRGAKAAGMTVICVYDALFSEAEAEMRRLCDGYIHDFSERMQ